MRYLHVSSEIVARKLVVEQPVIDDWNERVRQGQIRDVREIALLNGEAMLLGRTKGVTFKHASKLAYPEAKRASRRTLYRNEGIDW